MQRLIRISDLSAPELAVYARLTETQLRSRQHPENGLFIAESTAVITHALDAGCTPVSFLMAEKHASGKARALIDRCPGVPVYTADENVLCRLTGYTLTRGVLCAMKCPPPQDIMKIIAEGRRLAVLENITDSTNVGAIFRSAAALGADGILLSPSCCPPLCRRSVRVSMGTVFQVPWAFTPQPWPEALFTLLRRSGFKTAALALGQRSTDISSPELAKERKLALFFGTEGSGLESRTIEACDWSVRIPMSHGVDSLNVAAAAAVAFWQLRVRTGV
jgi:tRNA G18 (ribose-2'-O)-methylase SpoU